MQFSTNLIQNWLSQLLQSSKLHITRLKPNETPRFQFSNDADDESLQSDSNKPKLFSAGDKVESYVIRGKVKETMSGSVYSGLDEVTKSKCFLKVLPYIKSPFRVESADGAMREANMLLRCAGCRTIEPFLDILRLESCMILVTHDLSYTSVREALKYEGFFTEKKIKPIAKSLVEAISFLHENGISHWNVTADSVLLSDNGLAYLTDFSLANWEQNRLMEETVDRNNAVSTKPFNNLPWADKQIMQDGYRKDMRMLGTLLYQMFYGYTPTSLTRQYFSTTSQPHTAKTNESGISYLFEDFLHRLMSDRHLGSVLDIRSHTWLQDIF